MKMRLEHRWNDTDKKKLKNSEKNVSATNVRWTKLRLNSGLHDKRLANSRRVHGTAFKYKD
jgi:hypothetical protein